MPNSAHIYASKSGNWNISFHHPICREGSIGKKIHRSLRVSDEPKARELEKQMNRLLELAESAPSLLPTRSDAAADPKFARVVVDAFYDCMTPEPVDYSGLRDKAMPLPPRVRKTGPIPRVLPVGPTGVGKSRWSQHMLQTTAENFPMRGAGRTTVSDTEVIIDDVDYAAVLTIYAKNEIRLIVRENVLEACSFAYKNDRDREKIASKLLVDADKRFRFNFVLGQPPKSAVDIDEEEDEEPDGEADGTPPPTAAWIKLDECVDLVLAMTMAARTLAIADLNPTSAEDQAVVEEWWPKYIDRDELELLTEKIVDELESRLCAATGESSWPVLVRISSTPDRRDFFARLRNFYQNDRKLFGLLVTPLVQGIRVRGRFNPPEWAGPAFPWVLLDGQGVGHEQNSPTKISRTIPPELTKKFSGADLICLVDRSMPAMTGDAPLLLEDLIIRGHLDRLALVFTHFEAVSAPDLDSAARKAKVLEGLSNAVQAISTLPKAQKVSLESNAESKAFFLSKLDADTVKVKSTQVELTRLFDLIRTWRSPELSQIRPAYNEYQIADAVHREIAGYRNDWSEAELNSYNWKIMEALTNWIGNAHSDGYPKRGLYPGQDLARRLVAAVSAELDSPEEWAPFDPQSAEEASRILNAIRTTAGDKIDAYCRTALVQDPRTTAWLPAYRNISGEGTKMRRARTIARLLQDNAQLPSEGMGKFTKDVWGIVLQTIDEVCTPAAPPV